MNPLRTAEFAILAASLLSIGCSVPKKGGFADVAGIVQARTGKEVHWFQDTPEDAQVAEAIHALLGGELSMDAATQIALLNNKHLQATYADLGVAQADLVQAGLLRNPVFLGSVRSLSGSSSTNTEFGIVQDFLNIFLLPARKKLATAEFEESKLRVADAVLRLASDTKVAYADLQGQMQITAVLRTIADATEAAYEFARRQRSAGNLSALDLTVQQALYEQARVDLAISAADVLGLRERLTRLMGLWGTDTGWTIPGRLPDLVEEPPFEHLESLAISQRVDLAAARWEVEQLAKAHSITVHWRYFPLLDIGLDTEVDLDGTRVTGPILAIELPIFDQGQARVARIEAILRQSQQRMAALAIDIRSEVREAHNRLLAARDRASPYASVVIPLREQLVAESQKFYNFMLIGVYQLLQAKRDEIDAYRGYIESVRDYWIARADLERAVGGNLPSVAAGG